MQYKLIKSMNKAIRNNVLSVSLKKKGKGFISVFLRKFRNKIMKKNAELNILRLAFEQTPSAIFILDKDFRFEYVNSSFVNLSGYSKEELLNRTVGELFYRNDLPELNNDIVKGLLNGEKWEGELLTYNKNGLTYWANTIAAPYKDENGSVEGYIIIQQDTTEKRKMEVSLKESEQFYRTLIENSMEAISLTQNGKFILVNSAFLHLFGYTNDDIFRMDPQSFIAPEDRDRVMDIHYKRMRGEIDKQNYKASFIHKSGKRILTQLNASTIQLHGENASFITLSDITERTAMEIALRESEMKYRELAEMLPLAVYEHDLNGILTYLNKSGRVKFGIDSLEQPICAFSLILADDLERIRSNMSNNMAENLTSQANVYTAVRTNGEKFPVMIFASAVISEGKKIGTRGIFMDMTEHLAIQNALRISEKKYRELADMLPQAIYELDANGTPTYLNKAGMKAFGIDKGVTNKKAFDFFIPDDAQRMNTSLNLEAENLIVEEGNISAQPSEPTEFTVKRADGSTFPVLIYGTSIVENGKVVGSRGMIVDISDRKAMENALRESESKYKTLIENSQDGIFAIIDDKILFANNTFCKLLGYTSDELYNKLAVSLVVSDDRAKGLAISERRRQGDHSTVNDIFHFIAKDGSIKEGDVFSSVLELNGELVSYITVHDLTETRKIQEELIKSEQKYRELADFLPQTVYELDNQGNLLYMNKSGMEAFGLTDADYGLSALDSFIPEDRERMIENLRMTAIGKRAAPMNEYTAVHRDGTIFPVMIYGVPMYQNGILIGTRGIIVDITERKVTEKALFESEKKYRELAEMLPQTVYELDMNANIKYLNKTGREKFGTAYETSEVSVFSIVLPEQLELMQNNFKNVSFNNIPSNGNFYKLRQVDGQIFEAMISATPMIVDGKTVGQRGIAIDITDHVNMQNALRESEEKYRTLIENATDGIVIVQNGLLKFTNQAMCDIMKYSMDELLNKPFLDYIDHDEHKLLNDFHTRRMQGEQFSNIQRSQFIRKDKKMITVEFNARTSNYNGSPAGFIIIRDITERLKIEIELQTAKSKLELLNTQLEQRVKESSESLTEARTQLINVQKENLQSQFEVLKQQVNPHFLFNSLNVLTSLIKLEPDLAERFSEQLSKVYRYVLENKDNELVDLNTELNFLEAYIFLLNIRFVDKLRVNINIPEAKRSCQIIPLAMQLLIENAIKHNIMSKNEPLNIDVFIDSKNFLNIINNLQARSSQLVSTGVGLKNIQNRYMLLNNTEPIFEKTNTHFIAKVPLVMFE